MREHDFKAEVVREIGHNAGLICQNPSCLCFTSYSSVEGRPRRIAEAAHVLPSGSKGPRASVPAPHTTFDPASSENGLWLCKNCHAEIDGDPSRFPADQLFGWKKQHQDLVGRIVGKDIEAALNYLGNEKRYHMVVRDLLSYFDSRRIMHEGMNAESPPLVLESLELIRARLVMTGASINPDSDLLRVIDSLQAAVNRLLRNIGARTNLRLLRCDINDPKWLKFSDELEKFRVDVTVILKALADSVGFQLSFV